MDRGYALVLTLVCTAAAGARAECDLTVGIEIAETVGAPGSWRELRGTVAFEPTGRVTELDVFVEGPPAGVNLRVDDLEVILVCSGQ